MRGDRSCRHLRSPRSGDRATWARGSLRPPSERGSIAVRWDPDVRLSVVRVTVSGGRPLLSELWPQPGGGQGRGAARRHRAVRRSGRLHQPGRADGPRAGQVTGRRAASSGSWRTSRASAGGSTRSSVTPSWPCSALRWPTRTTPSGRCGRRCGCSVRSSRRSRPTWTCRIRMRIGVNTGEVLVGALRAGGDYTAMGDVVNTASRLQTAAPPGGVLVGPATHAATEGAIAYESVGEFQVRGRDEQVAAWLALEPLTLPGRRRRRMPVPFVGRGSSSCRCSSTPCGWPQSQRRAVLAIVEGEGGVGKTPAGRGGAAAAARRRRARSSSGACVPYGEANRWWPDRQRARPGARCRARRRLGRAAGPAGAPPVGSDRPCDRRGAPRRPRQRAAAPVRPAVTARRHRPGPRPPGAHPGRPGRARRAVREGSGHDGHRRPPLGQPAGAGAAGGRARPGWPSTRSP